MCALGDPGVRSCRLGFRKQHRGVLRAESFGANSQGLQSRPLPGLAAGPCEEQSHKTAQAQQLVFCKMLQGDPLLPARSLEGQVSGRKAKAGEQQAPHSLGRRQWH